MRYLLIFLLLIFTACQKKEKKVYIDNVVQIKTIKIGDLTFYEQNQSIKYSFNTEKVLVFIGNNDKDSQLQIHQLQKLKTKFYVVKDHPELNRFFGISLYPTTLVIDKNNTRKYEGFIPAEMLKYEIKEN